jgi:SAM-dependent methyltransferase
VPTRAESARPETGPPSLSDDARFVDACYWLLLGREPDEHGRKAQLRFLELDQSRGSILLALTGSTEFRHRRAALLAGEQGEAADRFERGLATLGDDRTFVGACYEVVLGRPADAGGLDFYTESLGRGEARREIVRVLQSSAEFEDRYAALCPAGGVIPVDSQLCELANPAKWDNPEWLGVLRELGLPAEDKLAMHRKAYEFTQTVWGLRRLNRLHDDAAILSVGAGHEPLLYWLANCAGQVIATDLYEGSWQSAGAAEGDRRVLTHPWEYAPFPYRRERLRFLQMDGCHLAFADGTFDIAYSLSSIEHFGGWAGSRRAVEEMARVLKPGGLVVLATEWRVAGPDREEVFAPEAFRELIAVEGLTLVEPLDDRVWQRYTGSPIDLRRNPYETPHMLVAIDGTVFTSVFVFLRKAGPTA